MEPATTSDAIAQICDSYRKAKETEIIDELILIPCFILDFLFCDRRDNFENY